jgi:hypothetical protein
LIGGRIVRRSRSSRLPWFSPIQDPSGWVLSAGSKPPRTVGGGQQPHLVALVGAGATFNNGVLGERPTNTTQQDPEKVVGDQLRPRRPQL